MPRSPNLEKAEQVVAQVKTIAVIGAGIMGRGIAHAAALGGYRTILEDLVPAALRKAETRDPQQSRQGSRVGQSCGADADAAFQRLEYAGSVEEAAREADLVIEAVPEEMESKIEIFTLLDKICRPGRFSLRTLPLSALPKLPALPIARKVAWACTFSIPCTR